MRTILATILMLPAVAATASGDVTFDKPVEIKPDGKAYSNVLYPSPVLFDLNGDGQDELIVGDLIGYLHVAERLSPGDPSAWGPVTKMKATDGKDLKFSNW